MLCDLLSYWRFTSSATLTPLLRSGWRTPTPEVGRVAFAAQNRPTFSTKDQGLGRWCIGGYPVPVVPGPRRGATDATVREQPVQCARRNPPLTNRGPDGKRKTARLDP
ncbi:hypothetical protein Kisp02_10530 [Kineosporia sp. NBRC 101731]|nr:hypothetical protein Kisp02_10530 [Kineosporia sp. NBRC 101731]